jgi:hypothetical protein
VHYVQKAGAHTQAGHEVPKFKRAGAHTQAGHEVLGPSKFGKNVFQPTIGNHRPRPTNIIGQGL